MKGLLHTLEAIIGIIAIFVVLILFYSGQDQLPEFDTINFKLRGFEALKTLDSENKLRDVAVVNDTATLKDRLFDLLPAQMNYDVVICVTDCSDPGIASERLTSITYLVAGDVGDFRYRQIILYMW